MAGHDSRRRSLLGRWCRNLKSGLNVRTYLHRLRCRELAKVRTKLQRLEEEQAAWLDSMQEALREMARIRKDPVLTATHGEAVRERIEEVMRRLDLNREKREAAKAQELRLVELVGRGLNSIHRSSPKP